MPQPRRAIGPVLMALAGIALAACTPAPLTPTPGQIPDTESPISPTEPPPTQVDATAAPTETPAPTPTRTPDPMLDSLLATPLADYANARLEESAAGYESLVRSYPDRVEPLLGLAAIAARQDDFEGALGYVQRATEAEPSNVEAWRQFAVLLDQAGNIEGLVNAYSALIALEPDNPDLYVARAITYAREGQAESAVADLQAATSLDPYRRYAWLNAAAAASGARSYDTAIAIASAGLGLYPDATGLLLERGTAHLSLNDPGAALTDFDAAIARNPRLMQAHLWRGRNLADRDERVAALEALERAASLGIESGVATTTLGLEAMADYADVLARDDPGAAFQYLANQVFQFGSRDPLLMGYARIDWRRGSTPQGSDRLEGLIKNGYVPAMYWRGVMLAETGDEAGAAENLRMFIETRRFGPQVEAAQRLLVSFGS